MGNDGKIQLKEFFRTGMFGPVGLGMTRAEVVALLGAPDRTNTVKENPIPGYSYGGVWMYFDAEKAEALALMTFKPTDLWYVTRNPRINRWLFRGILGPKIDQLTEGLRKAGIDYQDTGLQTLTSNRDKMGLRKSPDDWNEVLPEYNPSHPFAFEHFGTIVTRSGIYVRYTARRSIEGILRSEFSRFEFKGNERDIHWD